MPTQASNWAEKVDWVNNFITDVSIFCIVVITGVMLYFAVRYRRRSDNDITPAITHNVTLETLWTVIPSVMVLFTFYYGYAVYRDMRTPPPSAIEISVTGYKWNWAFEYPNGKKTVSELVVPVNEPVRLVMRSKDVNHSFFIPAMRVKEDVLASNFSYLWFEPTRTGEFRIFCAEYCGLKHSGMLATLRVVTREQYQDYLLDRQDGEAQELLPAELGEKLFSERGCTACHSIDGSTGLGPSLKGFFASKNRELASGEPAPIDENYAMESILNPNAKIAKGFAPNIMPAFEGQLNQQQIKSLIAYLKTL